MQLAGVHRQFHALVLCLSQLLLEFGDFELEGEAVGVGEGFAQRLTH